MTREKFYNTVTAAILASLIAMGSVGGLITGMDLNVPQIAAVAMVGALFAIGAAVCFSFRWGTFVMLGVLLLFEPLMLFGGSGVKQLAALITRMTFTYDQAYHCGVLMFGTGWKHVTNEMPMIALAVLVAVTVAWTVCYRRGVWVAVIVSLLPLVPCVFLVDTIPSLWCLFLLFGGLCVLVLTALVRRRDPDRAHIVTRTATAAVTVSLLLLFLLVPQGTYENPFKYQHNQILSFFGLQNGLVGGGDDVDGVNLKKLGSRFFLPYEVLEVTSSEGGTVYLREQDYNAYDGGSWRSSEARDEIFQGQLRWDDIEQGTLSVETRWFRNRLMVPYYPLEAVSLINGREHNVEKTLVYEWSVAALPDDWRADVDALETGLWDIYADEEAVVDSPKTAFYSVLPEDTEEWAKALLSGLLTDERSASDVAQTVADFVRNSAVYQDDIERMPSSEKDFVKWFIESADKGYCVHFATSTAVLLRAAGVETRYVTGYMVETEAGIPTAVTADMEHAWVEYYEPLLGQWVVLESTPAEVEQEEEETTQTTTATTMAGDASPTATTTTAVVPLAPSDKDVGKMLAAVGAAAVCLFAVYMSTEGQRLLRLRYRKAKWDNSSSNQKALLLWRRAERMAWILDEEAPEELLHLAQKAKYSQHTIVDEELAVFEEYLQASRQTLLSQPWYQRTIYRYIFVI